MFFSQTIYGANNTQPDTVHLPNIPNIDVGMPSSSFQPNFVARDSRTLKIEGSVSARPSISAHPLIGIPCSGICTVVTRQLAPSYGTRRVESLTSEGESIFPSYRAILTLLLEPALMKVGSSINNDVEPSAMAPCNALPGNAMKNWPISAFPTNASSTVLDFSASHAPRANPEHPAGLQYPVERYLPPRGKYYDQSTYADVMNQPFGKKKKWCSSCWNLKHGEPHECLRTCWICSTNEYLGRVSTCCFSDLGYATDLSSALL